MELNRRRFMEWTAGGCAAMALGPLARAAGLGAGKSFTGTRESLQGYSVPEWFRDAKFGIWSHWGPQSSVEYGDWYARQMYIQGSEQYQYHVARYGHPSKVGYKDLIGDWKAEKWDPDALMALFKKAGAKYFVSMGVHHDNFDLWDSKYTRWNSVAMGPKKDIVGLYREAARKQGLRFGVSEHLWISYKWFASSHGADKTGALAGIPYDGNDARFADLYHGPEVARLADKLDWNDDDIPNAWKKHYLDRMTDLIGKYQPDLLYTDGHLPFEDYGLEMVSRLYNTSAAAHGGQVEAVYMSKTESDCAIGTCLLDRERGVSEGIWANPWQTDTCIGQWHYKRGQQYKTPKKVIDLLVDIVSKNGNLLLNFPLPSSGALDAEELRVLEGITNWVEKNGEGIYGSRPWKIHGEGPATEHRVESGNFNEDKQKDLGASDIRFTKKADRVYAFVMGKTTLTSIRALGLWSPQDPGKVARVRILGHGGTVEWQQSGEALHVRIPDAAGDAIATTLEVSFS